MQQTILSTFDAATDTGTNPLWPISFEMLRFSRNHFLKSLSLYSLSMSSAISMYETAFEWNCTKGVAHRRPPSHVFFFLLFLRLSLLVSFESSGSVPDGARHCGKCSTSHTSQNGNEPCVTSREAPLQLPHLLCQSSEARLRFDPMSACGDELAMESCVPSAPPLAVKKTLVPHWPRTLSSNEDDAALVWQLDPPSALWSRNSYGLGLGHCAGRHDEKHGVIEFVPPKHTKKKNINVRMFSNTGGLEATRDVTQKKEKKKKNGFTTGVYFSDW